MRHAHRQHWHRTPKPFLQVVAQHAQAPEVRPHVVGIFKKRRNAHDASQVKAGQHEHFLCDFWNTLSIHPGFALFGSHTDFQENPQLGRNVEVVVGALEALRKRQIVYGIDAVKQPSGAASLVTLQVSDQMPRGLQVFNSAPLSFPLLDAVLAEVTQPRFERRTNGFRRLRFGDPNEGDLLGLASSALRGSGDALLHSLQICADKSRIHGGAN